MSRLGLISFMCNLGFKNITLIFFIIAVSMIADFCFFLREINLIDKVGNSVKNWEAKPTFDWGFSLLFSFWGILLGEGLPGCGISEIPSGTA